MYAWLRGELAAKNINPPSVVVDVNGVGYEVFVPLSTLDALPREGAACKIFTQLVVREDAHTLYGFATEAEKRFFLLLQTVSGVGPKMALSALSSLSIRELTRALCEGDVRTLSKISGVGKRTAERIAVELKGKIDPLEGAAAATSGDGDAAAPAGAAAQDAVLALTTLGLTQEAAVKAVRKIMDEAPNASKLSTEEIVRKAFAR